MHTHSFSQAFINLTFVHPPTFSHPHLLIFTFTHQYPSNTLSPTHPHIHPSTSTHSHIHTSAHLHVHTPHVSAVQFSHVAYERQRRHGDAAADRATTIHTMERAVNENVSIATKQYDALIGNQAKRTNPLWNYFFPHRRKRFSVHAIVILLIIVIMGEGWLTEYMGDNGILILTQLSSNMDNTFIVFTFT